MADHRHRRLLRPRRDRPRRSRAAEQRHELATPDHSITSSASASSVGGISRPSALAVLRLMASSNLTGCSTGRSTGLVPCRILYTYPAARRNKSGRLGPQDISPPAATFSLTTYLVGSRFFGADRHGMFIQRSEVAGARLRKRNLRLPTLRLPDLGAFLTELNLGGNRLRRRARFKKGPQRGSGGRPTGHAGAD